MKSPTTLILFLSVISLVGCGSSSSQTPTAKKMAEVKPINITADNQKSLFPFSEGNSWTYEVEIQRQLAGHPKETATTEMEYRITKVTKDGGFTKATLSVFQDGKKKDEQAWGVDDKGIYQLSMHDSQVPYSPKQPVLRFPVKDQDEFKWEGRGLTPVGKMGKMKYAYKEDGTQEADTASGPMNCIYMQTFGSFVNDDKAEGIIAVNSWFAPGVGLARYKQVIQVKGGESAITLRLKRYTVK